MISTQAYSFVSTTLKYFVTFTAVIASAYVCGESPAFTQQPLKPISQGTVVGIRASSDIDVVFVNAGYDQGFRVGTVCQVQRDSLLVASLVLVDVRPSYSAGLILDLNQQTQIIQGDIAKIKVQYPSY